MKRSETNLIAKARHDFSLEYDCVSSKQVDKGGNDCTHKGVDCDCESSEEYFSHSGCDICPDGLAATVVDIVYLARKDIGAGKFTQVFEGQVCGGCLCALVNGDDSDLDYSVTDEDEPQWSPK